MNLNELYLKTAFCCMSCDGDIAKDEVSLLKKIAKESIIFGDLNIQKMINSYIEAINANGFLFLQDYLESIETYNLSESEEINLAKLAITTIEADNAVEYSEVKFFKKIRKHLKVSDNLLMETFPDKEDFILPDVIDDDFPFQSFSFSNLDLNIA